MVAEPKSWFLTPEEYLQNEQNAETKSEFINGEIIAMAGASLNHVRLNTNIQGRLFMQLAGKPCEIFAQDLRVAMNDEGDYCYPDVGIVCEPEMQGDNLINAVVIIEILSPTTELKDRTIKFEALRRSRWLMDYILVSQNRVYIEHFHREADNSWNLKIFDKREDEMILEAVACRLKVDDIYARVEVPALQNVPVHPQNAASKSEAA